MYYSYKWSNEEEKLNIFKVISIIVVIVIITTLICFFAIKETIQGNFEESVNTAEVNIITLDSEEVDIIQEQKITVSVPDYSPETIVKLGSIYNNNDGVKKAFLTFDDGPSYQVTPFILDVLKANNIKATFFVLGSRVDYAGDLLVREFEEGHYIANHGYTHVYSKIYKNAQSILDEYYQCEYSIRTALKNESYTSHLFRFPGGFSGRSACRSKNRWSRATKRK